MLKTDTIQITPDLLALLTEIDEFKGAWRALGSLAPDRLIALRRVATIESIGSSTRIEGSKLTDREVEHLLARLILREAAVRKLPLESVRDFQAHPGAGVSAPIVWPGGTTTCL